MLLSGGMIEGLLTGKDRRLSPGMQGIFLLIEGWYHSV